MQRLEQDLPKLIDIATEGIDKVVDYGLLPTKAKKLARTALFNSAFTALDAFGAAFLHCRGYAEPADSDEGLLYLISLANLYHGGPDGFDKWDDRFRETFTHETMHVTGMEAQGELHRIIDRGNASVDCSWLNEAEVEQWTQVAFYGQPHISLPGLRSPKSETLVPHQELSHLLKTAGDVGIPSFLFGEAYVESRCADRTRKGSARAELDRLLHLSFKNIIKLDNPNDTIVEAIGRECASAPLVREPDILRTWIVRIRETCDIAEDNQPESSPLVTLHPHLSSQDV